jgi:hypothetical protein
MLTLPGYSPPLPLGEFLRQVFGYTMEETMSMDVAFFAMHTLDAPAAPPWDGRDPRATADDVARLLCAVSSEMVKRLIRALPARAVDFLRQYCIVLGQHRPRDGYWLVAGTLSLVPRQVTMTVTKRPSTAELTSSRPLKVHRAERASPAPETLSLRLLFLTAATQNGHTDDLPITPKVGANTSATIASTLRQHETFPAASLHCGPGVMFHVVDALLALLCCRETGSVAFASLESRTQLAANIATWLFEAHIDAATSVGSLCAKIRPSSVPAIVADSAHIHERKARARFMSQRLLSLVSGFIVGYIVPSLRRSFHITRATRNVGQLLFIPVRRWRAAAASALSAFRRVSELRPMTVAREVASRAAASPHRRTILHSRVRLVPDATKLRPIATVRFATATQMIRKLQSRRRAERFSSNEERAIIPSRAEPPNRGVLRTALGCLAAGRRRDARAGISHRRHSEELREFVSFADALSRAGPWTSAPVFVKADGLRCFDRLDQAVLVRRVTELMSSPRYAKVTAQLLSAESLAAREWQVTLTTEEYTAGVVPGIPAGYVATVRTVSHLDGEYMREVVLDAIRDHTVDMGDGAMFQQRRGIPQGNCLSPLLCDVALEELDDVLVEVLEGAQVYPCLLLRRTDDVLVGVCSTEVADSVVRKLRDASLQCGYECNSAKLQVTGLGGGSVPWCGLRVVTDGNRGFALQPDWSRLVFPILRQTGTGAPLHRPSLRRCLRCLALRIPAAVFSMRINGERGVAAAIDGSAQAAARAVLWIASQVKWALPLRDVLRLANDARAWLRYVVRTRTETALCACAPRVHQHLGDLLAEHFTDLGNLWPIARLRIAIAVLRGWPS